MTFRKTILAVAAAVALFAVPASAKTFRFAFQGDYKSLDPYTLNETFTLAMHGAMYEGLTKRGPKLEIIPECGHLSTMERPEAVNRALREWLAN